MCCWCNITAAFLSSFQLQNPLFIFMFLQPCDTHPALLAVGKEFFFFLGVEDERVWGEGDGLTLEGRTFVGADEQHLIPFIYGGAHQHYLEEEEGKEAEGQR